MVAVDVKAGAVAAGPKRDQVACSSSQSERTRTVRSGASPMTSPPPAGMTIGSASQPGVSSNGSSMNREFEGSIT